MHLSVFTPSHDSRFLDECWASLAAQSHSDFEWVVVLNGGAKWDPPDDPRIRVLTVDALRGVGAAKNYACSQCEGEILVELDHDDLLTTNALTLIETAFSISDDVGFVYSDGAQVQEDGSMDTTTWDTNNGWVYEQKTVRVGIPDTLTGQGGRVMLGYRMPERDVLAVRALEPTPHNVGFVWWAPNHVRSFRRSAYELAGGYDPDRDILDDQDLMCRLYRVTEFYRIPQPLYLQRCHAGMTQKQQELNDRIQVETVEMYDRVIETNCLAWARRQDLAALDLGGALNPAPGWDVVDLRDAEHVDFVGDVYTVLEGMEDSSVGVIRAYDFLEHLPEKIKIWNEIHRVLAPDGMALTLTPSTDGRGAWQDPTHTVGYNENSIWYLTDQAYAQYVPELTCKFQTSRAISYFPTDFHREHSILYIRANLVALKPGGSRNGGYVRW